MMKESCERSPPDTEKLPSEVYDLACAYLVLVFIVGLAANGSVTAIFITRKKVG